SSTSDGTISRAIGFAISRSLRSNRATLSVLYTSAFAATRSPTKFAAVFSKNSCTATIKSVKQIGVQTMRKRNVNQLMVECSCWMLNVNDLNSTDKIRHANQTTA